MTRPSNNSVTQGYSDAHKAYDFSGRGDLNVYACASGYVEQSVNLYVNSWSSKPPLTTRDYGNYIKLKHDDGTFSLYAHLKKDSLLAKGVRVNEGQVIAQIGNTGNSTGAHLHFEYRNSKNINIKPVFSEGSMDDMMQISKKDFGRIRAGSERSEAVHKELGLEGDHVTTPIDAFISAIKTLRGYKADATTMRNKLAEVEAEVSNRGEKISRLEEQLLKEVSLRKSDLAVYSEAIKAADKLRSEYQVRVESMQTELDEVYKEKGRLIKQVSILEAQVAELKKGIKSDMTLFEWVSYPIPWLIKKLKSITIKESL